MTQVRKFFALSTLALVAVACSSAPEETVETTDAAEVNAAEGSVRYAIITDGDEIGWRGYKTYSDDFHVGTIQVQEGELMVENGELVGGTFVIDMNSINDTDLTGEYKAKLEGHLKSNDFFAVADHPTATFTITSIEAAPANEEGYTHNLKGNLKMRDAEKNITVPAVVAMEGDMINISAPKVVIDRTQWGVQYGSETSIEGLAKENAISNNIELKVDLKAAKS